MTEAEAKVKAEALYDELDRGEFDENVPVAELRAWAVGKMAAALLARAVPEGCVRLPDGRDVRVLGTLPMTKDGCVMGDWASVYVRLGEFATGVGPVRSMAYVWTPVGDGRNERRGYPSDECYADRSAAEAATNTTNPKETP